MMFVEWYIHRNMKINFEKWCTYYKCCIKLKNCINHWQKYALFVWQKHQQLFSDLVNYIRIDLCLIGKSCSIFVQKRVTKKVEKIDPRKRKPCNEDTRVCQQIFDIFNGYTRKQSAGRPRKCGKLTGNRSLMEWLERWIMTHERNISCVDASLYGRNVVIRQTDYVSVWVNPLIAHDEIALIVHNVGRSLL